MAKEDWIVEPRMNMQHTSVLNRIAPAEPAAGAPDESEPALSVVTVYQDPLTRYWATELWERVGQLIHCGEVCRKSWKISDLRQAAIFPDAVQAAAEADVLVISVRDAEELPAFLYVWIDGWMPRRAGRAGALVALIGMPAQPDKQCDHASQYLKAVARRTGLDFLPRERKLLDESVALSARSGVALPANLTAPWSEGAASLETSACLR